MYFFGVDPGKTGAVFITDLRGFNDSIIFPGYTNFIEEMDKFFDRFNGEKVFGAIEAVHSMPGDGVVGAFTFGKNFGWWCMYLDMRAHKYEGFSYMGVDPAKWQKALLPLCKTPKETKAQRKKRIRDFANRTFNLKIKASETDIADAAIIALYASKKV
jgi:hypothetical protein